VAIFKTGRLISIVHAFKNSKTNEGNPAKIENRAFFLPDRVNFAQHQIPQIHVNLGKSKFRKSLSFCGICDNPNNIGIDFLRKKSRGVFGKTFKAT